MRRSPQQRTGAVLLALLVQMATIALLMWSRHTARTDDVRAQLVFVQPLLLATTPPEPRIREKPRSLTRREKRPPEPDKPPEQPPAGSTITEPRDWYAEMNRAARRSAEQTDAPDRRKSLDTRPVVPEAPRRRDDYIAPGTTISLPDGTVRFYGKHVVCTHTPLSLAEHFDVWAKYRPAKCAPREEDPAYSGRIDLSGLEKLERQHQRPSPEKTPPSPSATAE